MDIPEEITDLLHAAVSDAFPQHMVTHIEVEDVFLDIEAREIRITLRVDTAVDPKEFARGYFGLTGKVRRSLSGSDGGWGKFFPVITPSTGHGVHA
jgi:hypothetical protein